MEKWNRKGKDLFSGTNSLLFLQILLPEFELLRVRIWIWMTIFLCHYVQFREGIFRIFGLEFYCFQIGIWPHFYPIMYIFGFGIFDIFQWFSGCQFYSFQIELWLWPFFFTNIMDSFLCDFFTISGRKTLIQKF